MRRAALWGTLGTILVVPILACSGDTEVAVEAPPPPPPPPPSNEVADPGTTVQGSWKVFPDDADLRQLKILDRALDPTSDEADLVKRMTPPPTPEELKQYHDLKAAVKTNPDDPSVAYARTMIAMMKDTEMTVTANEVTLTVAGSPQTWTYTKDSESLNNLAITLSSAEKQSYVFESPDLMRLTMGAAPNELKLRFNRKTTEGKAGKGDGGGKAGKGGDGDGKAGKGGDGDGKAGKGKGGKGH